MRFELASITELELHTTDWESAGIRNNTDKAEKTELILDVRTGFAMRFAPAREETMGMSILPLDAGQEEAVIGMNRQCRLVAVKPELRWIGNP